MVKRFIVLVFTLCCLLTLAGSSTVLSAENESAQKDIEAAAKALKGLKFESMMYLSYQSGQESGNGSDFSRFALKRGYLTVKKDITPWFSARITSDISQVKDEAKDDKDKVYDNYDGSIAMRMKYLYGQFNLPDNALFTKPNIEVGLVHMPWIDFEEHINFYRMQDTMFIERNSIVNSADTGITFSALLGGTIGDDFQESVTSSYPGRYGSMSFGIYNGGGYHASEKNKNQVFEGRLTIRPLPDIIPGLQFSYFGISGKGNKVTEPDWNTNLLFISFEHKYLTLTGQSYTGKGSQGGSDENDKKGHSFFAEIKPVEKFSIIGRYDHFDPDTNSADNETDRQILGVAYMLDGKKHKNMILLDYDKLNYKQTDKKDDNRIQLTLQVTF